MSVEAPPRPPEEATRRPYRQAAAATLAILGAGGTAVALYTRLLLDDTSVGWALTMLGATALAALCAVGWLLVAAVRLRERPPLRSLLPEDPYFAFAAVAGVAVGAYAASALGPDGLRAFPSYRPIWTAVMVAAVPGMAVSTAAFLLVVREPAEALGRRLETLPLVGRELPLALLVVAAAAVYGAYSVLDHNKFGTAWDLGVFDQAIWHLSRFETPASTLSGQNLQGVPNLFGDHFHPMIALLTPLYWVWSDARMLLLAQGVLVALSIVPVFLYARRHVGHGPAYLLAVAYATFWGIQSAVDFDFHEVAFAPVLIASALLFADVRRWGWCLATLGLLLLVKEDLTLVVAVFGLYLLARRAVRPGLIALVGGVAGYLIVTKLFVPYFSGQPFGYWSYGQLGTDPADALQNILRNPLLPFEVAVAPVEKLGTLLYLFGPFLFLSLLSPAIILTLPLLAERMLSGNNNLWGTGYHYSLALAPIIAIAAADGVRRMSVLLGGKRGRFAAMGLASVVLVVNVYVGRSFPLPDLAQTDFYTTPAEQPAAMRAVGIVRPEPGSVAATERLVPHLSQRDVILPVRPGMPAAEWIVADSKSSVPGTDEDEARARGTGPGPARLVRDPRARYATVFAASGVVVLRRTDLPPRPPVAGRTRGA
jgi:uncharacterized membrane protein